MGKATQKGFQLLGGGQYAVGPLANWEPIMAAPNHVDGNNYTNPI